MDETLTANSVSGHHSNENVLPISQSYCAGASPIDDKMTFIKTHAGWGILPLYRGAVTLFYTHQPTWLLNLVEVYDFFKINKN